MSKILISDIFNELPVIETERLYLRKLNADDIDDIFRYASDDEVSRYLIWKTHKTKEDTKLFIDATLASYAAGEPGTWGIQLKSPECIIGTIGLHAWKMESSCIDIGYVIGKEYWNKGITTEALKAVIGFVFENTDINRIQAQHFFDNAPSGRVMEKCGMQFEGILRDYINCKGSFHSVKMYSILKREYFGR